MSVDLSLSLDPFLTCLVFICVVFQSIFGVGVLLFGTPILLLYGLTFRSYLGDFIADINQY